jgi:hypothetical protein
MYSFLYPTPYTGFATLRQSISEPKTTVKPKDLKDSLIHSILNYKEKFSPDKAGRQRADKLLEIIGLLTDQSDLNVFNHILEIINDFDSKSVLENSKRLRGQLSETLCKFLNIPNETINQNLQDMFVSRESEDENIRNIIMHRLINAKHAELSRVESEDSSAFVEDKLAQLRETLHRHLSLFLAKEVSLFSHEERSALDLLTNIYDKKITKEGHLLKMLEDHYYNEESAKYLASPLFSYINNALYEYFKIPEEKICIIIMNLYKGKYERNLKSSAPVTIGWFTNYNFYIMRLIKTCINRYFNIALEDKAEQTPIPPKEIEHKSLYQIMDNALKAYSTCPKDGDVGLDRCSKLRGIVDKLKENENDLFYEIMKIYNYTNQKLSLENGPALRTDVDKALAEFLGITEGDLCVQEFHDCHERLRNGNTIDYTLLRNIARRKLIDKAAQARYAVSASVVADVTVAETKSEISEQQTLSEKPNLITLLIAPIAALKTSGVTEEVKNQTDPILEKFISMANDESELQNWAIGYLTHSYYAVNLRHAIGKALCEHFDIKITATFLEKPPYLNPLQNELDLMLPLIKKAYEKHREAKKVVIHAAAPG